MFVIMQTNLQWKLVRKKIYSQTSLYWSQGTAKKLRDIQWFKIFRLKYLKKKEFKLLNHFDNSIWDISVRDCKVQLYLYYLCYFDFFQRPTDVSLPERIRPTRGYQHHGQVLETFVHRQEVHYSGQDHTTWG